MPGERTETIGKAFGRWTVVARANERGYGRYLCRCSCGSEVVRSIGTLRSGMSKGCTKCAKRGLNFCDLTGLKFGKLTVVRRAANAGSTTNWICTCGCGVEKSIASRHLSSGKTISCGCILKEAWVSRFGPDYPYWKGGRYLTRDGYVQTSSGKNKIAEHRLIMERHLGRKLSKTETVHHKNGKRADNRLDNLELWDSNHPAGQRVSDLVDWAVSVLRRHRPELLSKQEIAES